MSYDAVYTQTLVGVSNYNATVEGPVDGYRAFADSVNTGLQQLINSIVYLKAQTDARDKYSLITYTNGGEDYHTMAQGNIIKAVCSTSGNIIRLLHSDAQQGDWVRITLDGTEVYIHNDFDVSPLKILTVEGQYHFYFNGTDWIYA
jgi:hypothetical protein